MPRPVGLEEPEMSSHVARIRAASPKDIDLLAGLIADAYGDVALRFGLTPENCPRHPSNCTPAWIERDMERGVAFFILEQDHAAAGCAGLEVPRPGEGYLERLAVLPALRRRGCGTRLVRHVIDEASRLDVRELGIGLIAAQTELRRWYRGLGFTDGETRRFAHLPFEVAFMHYRIGLRPSSP